MSLPTVSAGWAVLTGRADWVTVDDVADMLQTSQSSEPVHVQNANTIPEAQRRAEIEDTARYLLESVEEHGGAQAVTKAIEQYRIYDGECYSALRKIGRAGLPNSLTLEQIAELHHIDRSTLMRWKAEALKGIAMSVVYGAEEFELDY